MKIINKKELVQAPCGTVYSEYTPDMISGDIHIKFGRNCNLELLPTVKGYEKDVKEQRETCWMTDDLNIQADYDDDQLFAVFTNTEVMQMINCLTLALCKGEAYFDMDKVYVDDNLAYNDKNWMPY